MRRYVKNYKGVYIYFKGFEGVTILYHTVSGFAAPSVHFILRDTPSILRELSVIIYHKKAQ
jgi:hypothetical protein